MSVKTTIGLSSIVNEAGYIQYSQSLLVSVGVSSTLVITAANIQRLKALILFNDSTNKMYLEISGNAAVSGYGIPLPAGAGFEFNVEAGDMPTTAIYAISAGASSNLLLTPGVGGC